LTPIVYYDAFLRLLNPANPISAVPNSLKAAGSGWVNWGLLGELLPQPVQESVSNHERPISMKGRLNTKK
jgi:hypothetical protein